MCRTELLKLCLYYKDEKECPYPKNDARQNFWFYEKAWVHMELNASNLIERYQKRYIENIFYEKTKDNVPIRLKALLYNRYCHFVDFQGVGFLEYYRRYINGIS